MDMCEKLIEMLIQCDEARHGIKSHADMSPSSSIKEISEFIASYIGK